MLTLAAVASIVHREDLWQLCRDELTGVDARTGGWDIRGRWFGVVVGPRRRPGSCHAARRSHDTITARQSNLAIPFIRLRLTWRWACLQVKTAI